MVNAWQPQFLYVACQHGAEAALKRELSVRAPELRPAFSRPGFVTFKLPAPPEQPEQFALPSALARTWGFSLGSVRGEQLRELAQQTWALPDVVSATAICEFAGMHVWQRDAATPGDREFEPGVTPLAVEAELAVRDASPLAWLRDAAFVGRGAPRNRWVLDVALVEPGQWFIGCHRTATRVATWPGGVPDLELPEHAVSRAYLKMAEALQWSGLPLARGEHVVELGCAPGGASQALLDAGLLVTGVDPAEVDPEVAANPRFNHVRTRVSKAPKRLFRGAHWLAADMNVAPKYTLDAAESVVKHRDATIRGMILTLKLADWALIDELPSYLERVRSWGYKDVRLRQLAFNRQEICLAALRSRAQRRMLRAPGERHESRRLRHDAPHASVPAPHVDPPQA
ncbi:MAG TPA: SAM-dependent methyltransferase [Lacipirellulaceae bacterium]|nr:SAM-dependent methyltransferase [Lacipirellulaceae bacterium]